MKFFFFGPFWESEVYLCEFFLGSDPVIFEGRTEGTIVPARGPKVFGWDAVFEPMGYDVTCAVSFLGAFWMIEIILFYFIFLFFISDTPRCLQR